MIIIIIIILTRNVRCCIPGYQTLGEEYVNLVQVDSTLRQVPSQMVSTEGLQKPGEEFCRPLR